MTDEEELFINKILNGHYKSLYATNIRCDISRSHSEKQISKTWCADFYLRKPGDPISIENYWEFSDIEGENLLDLLANAMDEIGKWGIEHYKE